MVIAVLLDEFASVNMEEDASDSYLGRTRQQGEAQGMQWERPKQQKSLLFTLF